MLYNTSNTMHIILFNSVTGRWPCLHFGVICTCVHNVTANTLCCSRSCEYRIGGIPLADLSARSQKIIDGRGKSAWPIYDLYRYVLVILDYMKNRTQETSIACGFGVRRNCYVRWKNDRGKYNRILYNIWYRIEIVMHNFVPNLT